MVCVAIEAEKYYVFASDNKTIDNTSENPFTTEVRNSEIIFNKTHIFLISRGVITMKRKK